MSVVQWTDANIYAYPIDEIDIQITLEHLQDEKVFGSNSINARTRRMFANKHRQHSILYTIVVNGHQSFLKSFAIRTIWE